MARPSATPATKRSEAEITTTPTPTPAIAMTPILVIFRRKSVAARSARTPIRSRT
jgi:hypothetical protein